MHRDGEVIIFDTDDEAERSIVLLKTEFKKGDSITVEQAVTLRGLALITGAQYKHRATSLEHRDVRYFLPAMLRMLNKSQANYALADAIEGCLYIEEVPIEEAATEISTE